MTTIKKADWLDLFRIKINSLYKYLLIPVDSQQSVTESKYYGLIHKFILGIMALSFIILLVYIGWSLERGFSITDEAYYLTNAMYPETVKPGMILQNWLLQPLWFLTGTLTSFRAIGALLLITSAVVLALGVLHSSKELGLINPSKLTTLIVVFSTVAAALLYCSFIPPSPSYNLIANTFTYSAVGFCLLASGRRVNGQVFFLYFFCGVSVAFILMGKFSAAILAYFIISIYIWLFSNSVKERVFAFTVITLSSILTFFIFLNYYSTAEELMNGISISIEMREQMGTSLSVTALIEKYFTEFNRTLLSMSKIFMLPFFAVFAYLISRQRIFLVIGLCSLIFLSLRGEYFTNIIIIHQVFTNNSVLAEYTSKIMSMMSILFVFLMLTFEVWTKNRKVFLLLSGLLILPYCVAVGSGNSLYWQVLISLAPWGAMMAILALSQPVKDKKSLVPLGLCAVFFVAITLLVTFRYHDRPYHLNKSLVEQNIPVEIGNIGVVNVDEETKKFIDDLSAAVKKCNILPGTPYLGLYNNVGIALAIQGRPFFNHFIHLDETATFLIEHADPELVKHAVIGLHFVKSADGTWLVPEVLANFGEKYRFCGVATFPWKNQRIGIFQPKLAEK